MEAIKILQSSALDIVFDNRNKLYGAYLLRKNYYKRLLVAITAMVIVAAIFSIVAIHQSGKIIPINKLTTTVVNIQSYKKEKPIEKPKIKIPVLKKAEEPPKLKMVKNLVPVVAKDNLVKDVPPKQDDKLTIGPVTQNGKTMNGLLAAPKEVIGIGGTKLGIEGSTGTGDGDGFINVQVEAKFPGGEEAWRKYLHDNLRQDIPLDNGASTGQYVVTVSFLVSTDGTISDVKAIDAPTPDYGTANEAIRVILRGPKWNPAIQNGRPVPYHQRQRIIFQVQQE